MKIPKEIKVLLINVSTYFKRCLDTLKKNFDSIQTNVHKFQ